MNRAREPQVGVRGQPLTTRAGLQVSPWRRLPACYECGGDLTGPDHRATHELAGPRDTGVWWCFRVRRHIRVRQSRALRTLAAIGSLVGRRRRK
jgi:hypothetical protein